MNLSLLPWLLFCLCLLTWLIPPQYLVIACCLIAIAAVKLKYIAATSAIIIIIMALCSYLLFKRNTPRPSPSLRIGTLLFCLWALMSQSHYAAATPWWNLLSFQPAELRLQLTNSLEIVLSAIILAAYLLTKHQLSSIKAFISLGLALIIGLCYSLNHSYPLISGLICLIVVIFSNEIIYRLVLQQWLYEVIYLKSESLASWLAIVLSAGIYGLFHINYGSTIVILTVLGGSAYGYIYQKSGKIELAIFAHLILRLILGLILAVVVHSPKLQQLLF